MDSPVCALRMLAEHVQARKEVERLEGRKAEAMRAVMALKRRELEDICAAARMLPPPPPADVAAADALEGAAASAQAPPCPPCQPPYAYSLPLQGNCCVPSSIPPIPQTAALSHRAGCFLPSQALRARGLL